MGRRYRARIFAGPRLVGYVIGSAIPAFIMAIAFFVALFEILDLFQNLWKYMSYEVPPERILTIMALYAPKCVSYVLPLAYLFAVAFTLGKLYASNELVIAFCSGVSLVRFVMPLFAISLLLSFGGFWFDDAVVIPALRTRNEIQREALKQKRSLSSSDVAVLSRSGLVVYRAAFFDDESMTLTDVSVVERAPSGAFAARLDAKSATWDGERWAFSQARRFFYDPAKKALTDELLASWTQANLDEPPASFRNQDLEVADLRVSELGERVAFLQRAGLPYAGPLAEYYKRFAFALAPFIVSLLACGFAGWFKKNVLLMSLLYSLVIATLYYVAQMVTMLFAKNGILSPLVGATSPVFIFLILGALLYRTSKT